MIKRITGFLFLTTSVLFILFLVENAFKPLYLITAGFLICGIIIFELYLKIKNLKEELLHKSKELNASENRVRTVLDVSYIPYALNDDNQNIVYLNPAFTETFGYTREDIPTLSDWWPKAYPDPEYRHWVATTWQSHLEEAKKENKPFKPYDLNVRCKDGTIKTVIASVASLNEFFAGTHLVILFDITSRKKAEEALKENEERFRQAVSLARLGIWKWDIATDKTDWYGNMFHIYGITEEEFTGKGIDYINFTRPDYRERQVENIKIAFENGITEEELLSGKYTEPDPNELCIVRRDGSECFTLGNAITIIDENKNPIKMLGITLDITERKKVEEALQESEKKYRYLFNNSPLPMWIFSIINLKILDVNHTAIETYGYSEEEFLNMTLAEIRPAEEVQTLYKTIAQLPMHKDYSIESKHKTKDGKVIDVIIWSTPIQYKNEKARLVIVENITERKILEDRLRKAKEASEDANRAKSEFLAKMSHEIRTPMNGVMGMVSLLLTTELDAEQKEYANTAYESAKSLLTVINDILDFSKIEARKLTIEEVDFNLDKLIEECTALLGPRAKDKGLKFSTDNSSLIPKYVKGDPGRIRQILVNLISNAIKFTKAGSISVSIKLMEEFKDSVVLRFSVTDTGIGIPVHKQERLFESFYQTDSSTTRLYGGTGLGLTISRQLTHLMGGEIGFSSVEGFGSEFWFVLKLKTGDIEKITQSLTQLEISSSKSNSTKVNYEIRILIAEDNEINYRFISSMLRKLGFKYIDLATNGREVINSVCLYTYDLILMDIQMPEMDGYEATKKIRAGISYKTRKNIPIIAITAEAMEGEKEKCKSAGMNDYLSKPVAKEDLLEVIGNWSNFIKD